MNDYSEGAYTVLSATHCFNVNLAPEPRVFIQNLAVLWNDRIDVHIIGMIEKGLIQGVLSPVKLLSVTEGTLNILYDSSISKNAQIRFEQTWSEIARKAWGDVSIASFISETQLRDIDLRNNDFAIYADYIICSHGLGIGEFKGDRLHYLNRWQPDNHSDSVVSNPRPEAGPENDFGTFDDELPF
ncbi:hypothetical protein [Pseudomonas frederiksbergensis]|uniref:Uncharacterized protein n=1 Tax=Pseudomonas frederiksbergensis TaxID=104087 RepID=A0A0B1Z922_9PSED|nr:hypothetical protein [Pseudomonas frederiksbergensis]KHK65897.1 hypothetical protein JZ00_03745 [Pseudomonas frederiksbergensis]